MLRSSALVAVGCLGFAGSAGAAVIAQYPFTGNSSASTVVQPNTTVSTFDVGPSSGFGGYSSLGNPEPSRLALYSTINGASEAEAVAAGDFWTFQVDAADGYELDLTSLSFDAGRGSSTSDIQDVTFFVRANVLDDYGTTFGSTFSGGGANMFVTSGDIALGSAFQNVSGPVIFRIYVFDGTSTTTGTAARIDNVILNGEVTPIPEPGSLALLAVGGFLVVPRRRG